MMTISFLIMAQYSISNKVLPACIALLGPSWVVNKSLMVLPQLNVFDRLILESFRKKIKHTYSLRHASSFVQMCYLVLM